MSSQNIYLEVRRATLEFMHRSEHMGGDNSNKRCFGTKPKLFRESGDFSGNRDTWTFFRETRDNSGTMQKKIGTSGNVSPKFGRMIQISGTT